MSPRRWQISGVAAAYFLSLITPAAQIQTAGTLFVNVDATALPLGTISTVTNSGATGGLFEARGGGATVPRIAIAGTSGARGIQFDGGDYMQHVVSPGGALVPAPAGLVGLDPTRTIEVWVLNPAIADEETILAWGRRGGPDGSNMGLNYGANAQFGAVAHWGAAGPDLGWNNAGGAPPPGQWHHLVYTYDQIISRVYADGVLQNTETLGPGAINTHAGFPICLATQLEADGTTPNAPLRGSLTLARVRIHDGVLTQAQIENNYNFEKAAFQDPTPVPLASAPLHRYSFNEPPAADANGLTFTDSISSAHGTVRGSGSTFNGTRLLLTGGASTTAAYGDLPNSLISARSTDNGGSGELTIEGWVKVTGNRSNSRIFDFGSTTAGELTAPGGSAVPADSLTLYAQVATSTTTRRAEIRNSDSPPLATNTIDFATTFNTNLHFALTWREGETPGEPGEILVYENGVPLVAITTPVQLSHINDVNVWLGRANNTADLNAQIEYDELRIYNHALSPSEVRGTFALGPGVVNVAGPVGIYAQPENQTVVEGGTATFTVGPSGSPPFYYQWLKNSIPLPPGGEDQGEGATYTLTEVSLADNNAQFSVVISNVVNATVHSITSSNALLTVLPDTNGPVLLSAIGLPRQALFVIDAVQVDFNEPVQAATANDTANYSLSGPEGTISISSAALQPNGDPSGRTSVVLTTATPLTSGALYTLRVSNLRDRSVAANPIAPNSQVQFVAGFTLRTVGTITASNSVTTVPGGFNITAAGRDIGDNADAFSFHSQQWSGDFDVQVRVESLGLADGYSEAGLMARSGTAANAPFAAVLARPALGGVTFQTRSATGSNALSAGSMPVNYPYTWLRLQRTGNTFTGFGSLDGQTWLRLGSATVNMSSAVYVGFALSSHNPASAVSARFRNAGYVSGGTIVNHLPLPFEPLGPSSRRTGLVISEIMYHPAEVAGVTNLEFIEIFNGQDYYEDLSGYRIDGDVHYTFPQGMTLQSGGFLVIARNPATIQSYYGISNVLGPWRLQTNIIGNTTNVTAENLPNSRGTVRLENELGAHLLEVNYDSEGDWPAAADGAGHSLVLARPSYGEGDVRAWAASEFLGGSPSRAESYVPEPQRALVINEFLANSDDPQLDFVELFNTSTQPVDLSGCWLSDDFGTNKFRVPNGTMLPARSSIAWDENQLGFGLSSDGEEILLVNSNRTRVLDTVRFEGQAAGISRGRLPDGSPGFKELSTPTFGTNNAAALRRDVIINEIMYNPISDNDDDEFIELYNRGSSAVNVGDWRFVDGIDFAIPLNTTISPGGYLVVAKNRTNLLARYPGLNPNLVVGDYGGQLANGGERVALGMPEYSSQTNGSVITTNAFYIVVNEVTYSDGGRWGRWTDGGGSSLELIDPRADNRLAANWADSDESAKAPWTLIERTALIDLGMTAGNGTPNRCEFYIESPGECLVDEVEVLSNGGTNRVANAGFESGATGWAFQGTHATTFVQSGGAFSGSQCLHLRAVERGDPGPNRVRTAIAQMTTGGTNQATLRARVRWLRGDPNFLMRIRGQWIECGGRMTLPTNLGTPGAANSRRLANAGPAIYDVAHSPILPAANEPVVVTARVNDPDVLSSLTLRYRVDPSAVLLNVTMRDDGTGGDGISGDGIYSGTIPGVAADRLVAFHIRAQDAQAGAASFPSDAPGRECLVRFGESLRPGSIGTYRLWLTESNINYWTARERNSNEGLDATFVYGNWRVVYNAETLYSGSPWHTANGPYNGPLGNTCDYEVNFPADDLFLGSADFVLNGQNPVYSGTFHQDVSAQAETTAYWFGRKLGLAFNYKRHVFVVMNGQFRGMIYFDHQQPNSDTIDEYFPNDANGRLHKIEDWFEFDDAGNGFNIITCTLENFLVGGQKRAERYRFTWRPRARTEPNDFADLFALVDAANSTAPEPYTSATLGLMDMRTCMRVWALQHMIGNWDSYGYERGKNMYAYKPREGGWKMVLWDLDLVLGKDSRGPTDGLFSTAGSEPVVSRMYGHPPFVREYWCAMHELANIWMDPAVYSPLVDARYAAFRANSVPVDSPDSGVSAGASGGMRGWIAARRSYILSQIPSASFSVAGTNFIQTANNYITLTGSAPVTAKDIVVNGGTYPITWTTALGWTMRVPVGPGTNQLVVSAVDRAGNVLSNRTVTVNYTGAVVNPAGVVAINEIMYDPPVDQTSFVELFNTHSSFAFDLSNWRVNGLSYTFPRGAALPPRSYLVLARNRGEFAKLYGGTRLVFDNFEGGLDNDGETLTLLRPGNQPGEELVVDKVKYEARAPWLATAAGGGNSLQLIDPAQDHARVSNWGDGTGWRFFSITGTPGTNRLLLYLNTPANVYLDQVALVPGTLPGAGTNFLANGGFEGGLPPWQLLGTNGANTTTSAAARLTGNFGLDLRFAAPGGLSQYLYQDISDPAFASNTVHTLSFWYLPIVNANLEARMSASFRATVQVRVPLSGISATPGANNYLTNQLPPYPQVWLNELLPINTSGITDIQGERDPWIELYNSSGAPIQLDGLFLTDDYLNLTKWPFPANAGIDGGGFKVIFADGEPNESTAMELHTNFRLTSGMGSVALTRMANGLPQIVDYLNFEDGERPLQPNRSFGSCPDGQLFDRQSMFFTTPGAVNNCAAAPLVVFINEWMAANNSGSGIADPADNQFEDWFELYNPNAFTVDLGGYFLTDLLTNKFQYEIPNNGHYTIPPFGYLMVWADGEFNQNSTSRPDLHVNFQLRAAGEDIGLFAADGRLVDAVTFTNQTSNVSEGRYPDGTGSFYRLPRPSPRGANTAPCGRPEIISLTAGATQVSLTISTTAGCSYRIEYTDDLGTGPWSPVAGNENRLASSNTLTVQDTTVGGAQQRFYRIVRLP